MQWPSYLSVQEIERQVAVALAEDIGSGDLTAALIPSQAMASATLLSREPGVFCGQAWADAVFRALGDHTTITWHCAEGERLRAGQTIAHLQGPARTLLTGERTALNFLQLLCGTASITAQYVEQLAQSSTRLLDTRKTIPGLRTAQKYAVLCGGGQNHRMGLYDAVLIKENHIAASGGITAALKATGTLNVPVHIEVETLEQLDEALNAGARHVLLDNFSMEAIQAAVERNSGLAYLEASGNVTLDKVKALAKTGVDYLSVGAITKQVLPLDLSLLFEV